MTGPWIMIQARRDPARDARSVRCYNTDGMRQFGSYLEVEEPAQPERLTQTWVHFPSGWRVERQYVRIEEVEDGWKFIASSVFGSDGKRITIDVALEDAALRELGWVGEPR